jgi:ankyrin repeat protein
MYAALKGKQETAALLLAAGARADATDTVGWTPLHFAARQTDGAVLRLLVRLLTDRRETVDLPDNGGTTPLMIAAAHDNAEAVRILLYVGADPSLTDRTGRDARGYAALKNAESALSALEARDVP